MLRYNLPYRTTVSTNTLQRVRRIPHEDPRWSPSGGVSTKLVLPRSFLLDRAARLIHSRLGDGVSHARTQSVDEGI